MKTKFLIFIFIFCITSCSSLDFLGYKNLGNHYFIWEGDHYKYSIIWSKNENDARSGGALVTGLNKNVVKYNYNKNYIIAKTTEYKNSGIELNEFWLIDKRISVDFNKENWKDTIIKGPLDSIALVNCLRKNKIELKLKDVPYHYN